MGEYGSIGLSPMQRSPDILTIPNISTTSYPHLAPATHKIMWKNIFFYLFRNLYLMGMDKLEFIIERIEEGRLRVEILFRLGDHLESLGILYFEKAKRGFSRKPIGMDAWACVDAKVEGLYTKDESITPKDIVGHVYQLIKSGGY